MGEGAKLYYNIIWSKGVYLKSNYFGIGAFHSSFNLINSFFLLGGGGGHDPYLALVTAMQSIQV